MAIFSRTWNRSKKARKQHNYRLNAPYNVKGKFLSAHLSKELRAKYKTRSIRVRTGDTVKVVRGNYKGKTGKVDSVDLINSKVTISGVFRMKKEGSKSPVPINPSNLIITALFSDKKRGIFKKELKEKKNDKTTP